jgi:hypothetical protein
MMTLSLILYSGDPKKRNENDAKALAEKIARKKGAAEGGG